MKKKVYYTLSIILLLIIVLIIVINSLSINHNKVDIDTSNWIIPSYLTEKSVYELYKDDKFDGGYDIIFKDRDAFIDIKIININEKIENPDKIELDIYSDEDELIANFNYNNKNYIIETKNITKEELLDLIKSIIKD